MFLVSCMIFSSLRVAFRNLWFYMSYNTSYISNLKTLYHEGYCMKFELLKGNLFTSREFRLRTNVVWPNCESTYVATFYIFTETIVTITSRYTKRQPRFRLAGVSQTFYFKVIAIFGFLTITTHTCNRVGQARVLFYMVYI